VIGFSRFALFLVRTVGRRAAAQVANSRRLPHAAAIIAPAGIATVHVRAGRADPSN